MEKTRKIKIISLCALLVAVLGLTVAFASLSQTLTINGSAAVNTASWDIHFDNIRIYTSGAGSFNGDPTLSGTSITNINAVITKPEDQASFDVNMVNNGTINAKIESVEISKLCTLQSPAESCDWDNDGTVTQADIDKVNDNISFVMAYGQGNNVENGNLLKAGDTLNAGESKNITVVIAYVKFVEIDGSYSSSNSYIESVELPKRNLKFNNLIITINYAQAE